MTQASTLVVRLMVMTNECATLALSMEKEGVIMDHERVMMWEAYEALRAAYASYSKRMAED